jgi:hypothetical protein
VRPRFLLVVVAGLTLAAPAAAVVYPARPWDAPLLARAATRDERIAEAVAQRLTRRTAVVRCANAHLKAGELGITPFVNNKPVGYFLMAPETCALLAAFRSDPNAYDPRMCRDAECLEKVADVVQALETISHESYHLLGYRNEATAECYGLQSLWYSAVKLGAAPDVGETLAALYAKAMYPARRTSAHPEYWSSECRDGGKLDLRPRSHAWPS